MKASHLISTALAMCPGGIGSITEYVVIHWWRNTLIRQNTSTTHGARQKGKLAGGNQYFTHSRYDRTRYESMSGVTVTVDTCPYCA